MDSGDVPQIVVPVRRPSGAFNQWSRGMASFKGVWPPNWTMTPAGCSASITLSTSSSVSGSK